MKRHMPEAKDSPAPLHHLLWLANVLQDSAWCHIPGKPSLTPKPGRRTHCVLSVLPPVGLSCCSITLSFQDAVRGRPSFHASQPLEWLGETWGRWNQPSSYSRLGDHDKYYHFLCVLLSEKGWVAPIWWFANLSASFTQRLCCLRAGAVTFINVWQTHGRFSATVRWQNEGGLHGRGHTGSEPWRMSEGVWKINKHCKRRNTHKQRDSAYSVFMVPGQQEEQRHHGKYDRSWKPQPGPGALVKGKHWRFLNRKTML